MIYPAMRTWMADVPQCMPPVAIGEAMRTLGPVEIVESRSENFQKRDKFTGLTWLQEYCIITDHEPLSFHKVLAISDVHDTFFLSTLGIAGLAAYFGLTEIAKAVDGNFDGQTLVVSAAAGATGDRRPNCEKS